MFKAWVLVLKYNPLHEEGQSEAKKEKIKNTVVSRTLLNSLDEIAAQGGFDDEMTLPGGQEDEEDFVDEWCVSHGQ